MAGLWQSGCDTGSSCGGRNPETGREKMGEGARGRRSSGPPAVGPLRLGSPESHGSRAAFPSPGSRTRSQLLPCCFFTPRGSKERERGEAGAGAADRREETGCVSAEGGVRAIVSVQPRGCVFIYLF